MMSAPRPLYIRNTILRRALSSRRIIIVEFGTTSGKYPFGGIHSVREYKAS